MDAPSARYGSVLAHLEISKATSSKLVATIGLAQGVFGQRACETASHLPQLSFRSQHHWAMLLLCLQHRVAAASAVADA